MAGRAAFEGRRLPAGPAQREREQEHFPWFTLRRTAAHPRGGESITGRRAAQPQARQGSYWRKLPLGGLSRGIWTRRSYLPVALSPARVKVCSAPLAESGAASIACSEGLGGLRLRVQGHAEPVHRAVALAIVACPRSALR